MTTEARVTCFGLALFACAGLGLPACASLREERRGDTVDVSRAPPHIQRAYRVFALRCSRCHTLARPLNARIHDPQHWVRYVQRMRRQPGSGIDRTNADLILAFLLHYHRRQEPLPQAPVAEPSAPPLPQPVTPLPPPPTTAPSPAPPADAVLPAELPIAQEAAP